MAENQTTSVVPKNDAVGGGEEAPNTNPVLSFFSNFLKSFNFPPPPKKAPVEVAKTTTVLIETKPTSTDAAEPAEEPKPVTVKFPETRTAVAPLKLEADELERDTNPVVLWQVYAIGGFFVLRWALARWKERRARKPPSNEPSSEDPPPNPNP